MIYLKYLWYVIKHKYYVGIECFKRGLYWRGIIHDMSKFFPSEFGPYARHFMGNISKGRDGTGYYKPYDTGDYDFDYAWFLHQKRNSHHWQYWVLPLDNRGYVVRGIPYDDVIEMICDWIGAGKAQGATTNVWSWYHINANKLQLHPKTRELLEDMLGEIFYEQ